MGAGTLGSLHVSIFAYRKSESCSVMSDFATPWTIWSMEFSRPEYWSGKPFPSPGDLPNPGIEPRSPTLQADALPAEPQGKPKNAWVGGLSLFQPIFLTQESNWGLLHCRQILYQLSYQEAPCIYSDCICVYVIRVIVLTVGRQHVFVSVWCMCQSVCENKSVWC